MTENDEIKIEGIEAIKKPRFAKIETDGNIFSVTEGDMSLAELREFCKTSLENHGYSIVRRG